LGEFGDYVPRNSGNKGALESNPGISRIPSGHRVFGVWDMTLLRHIPNKDIYYIISPVCLTTNREIVACLIL